MIREGIRRLSIAVAHEVEHSPGSVALASVEFGSFAPEGANKGSELPEPFRTSITAD